MCFCSENVDFLYGGGVRGCQGGAWLPGGMCGCWGGVCGCRGGVHHWWGGCAWLPGGMRGCQGGMRGCRGACMDAGGRAM